MAPTAADGRGRARARHDGETVVVDGRAADVLLEGNIHTSKLLVRQGVQRLLGLGTARTVKVLRTLAEKWC